MSMIRVTAIPAVFAIIVATYTGPTATAAGLKKGIYKGEATVTTALPGWPEMKGRLQIEVESLDDEGHVTAEMSCSNGLSGQGKLKGTIDREGSLKLRGVIVLPWTPNADCKLMGRVEGDKISGKFNMVTKAPISDLEQDATFDLKYEEW
jgi:hypothetical protein